MYQYKCGICDKAYPSDAEQLNPICSECKSTYGISDDYINGTGEYEKKPKIKEIEEDTEDKKFEIPEDEVRSYYLYGEKNCVVQDPPKKEKKTSMYDPLPPLPDEVFSVTKSIDLGFFNPYILVDGEKQKWCLSNTEYATINSVMYSFSDIAKYEYYQDSDLVQSGGHGIGRAIVGGLLAGSTGAIVGAATSSRKTSKVIRNMYIRISFKDVSKDYIKIQLASNVSAGSFLYNKARQRADEIISLLDGMTCSPTTDDTAISADNTIIDQLGKYKELLDNNAISQDEYESIKQRLLLKINL